MKYLITLILTMVSITSNAAPICAMCGPEFEFTAPYPAGCYNGCPPVPPPFPSSAFPRGTTIYFTDGTSLKVSTEYHEATLSSINYVEIPSLDGSKFERWTSDEMYQACWPSKAKK